MTPHARHVRMACYSKKPWFDMRWMMRRAPVHYAVDDDDDDVPYLLPPPPHQRWSSTPPASAVGQRVMGPSTRTSSCPEGRAHRGFRVKGLRFRV